MNIIILLLIYKQLIVKLLIKYNYEKLIYKIVK